MLMLEMTLYQLDRSTQNTFGDGREYRSNVIQISKIDFIKQQTNGKTSLLVKGTARGSTGMNYTPTIQFNKVNFEEQDTNANVTVDSESGPLHMTSQSLKSSDVLVRCDCMDFYWRFAVWNKKHKSLLGDPPPPYAKTTDRPPVNPDQKPGTCKHLYRLVKQLKARGMM